MSSKPSRCTTIAAGDAPTGASQATTCEMCGMSIGISSCPGEHCEPHWEGQWAVLKYI